MLKSNYKIFSVLMMSSLLSCCSSNEIKYDYPKSIDDERDERIGKIFGDKVFKFSNENIEEVNNFKRQKKFDDLWQATIDVINNEGISIASSDKKNGLLLTEWFHHSGRNYKLEIKVTVKKKKCVSIDWQDSDNKPDQINEAFKDYVNKIIDKIQHHTARQWKVQREF